MNKRVCIKFFSNKKINKNGSMIIELALIMPVVMGVVFFILFYSMFLHDKCVLERCCYKALLSNNSFDKQSNFYSEIYYKFDEETQKGLFCKWDIERVAEENEGEICLNIKAHMKVYSGYFFGVINERMYEYKTSARLRNI